MKKRYYDYLNGIIDNEKFYLSDQAATTIMALGSPEFQVKLYTINRLLTNKIYCSYNSRWTFNKTTKTKRLFKQ